MRVLLASIVAGLLAIGVATSGAGAESGGEPATWTAYGQAAVWVIELDADHQVSLMATRLFSLPGFKASDSAAASVGVSQCRERDANGACIWWEASGCDPAGSPEGNLLPDANAFVINYMTLASARLSETTFTCQGPVGVQTVTAEVSWTGSGGMSLGPRGAERYAHIVTAEGTVTVDGTAYPFAQVYDTSTGEGGSPLTLMSQLYRDPIP